MQLTSEPGRANWGQAPKRANWGQAPNWGQAQSGSTANQLKQFMPVPFFSAEHFVAIGAGIDRLIDPCLLWRSKKQPIVIDQLHLIRGELGTGTE